MKCLFVFVLVCMFACDPQRGDMVEIRGFAPVYMSAQSAVTIETQAAKPTIRPGKIYAFSNYVFQVEQNEGIHIVNNTNPQQPQKVAFLKIPTCAELAIRGNYLYTNNLNDLLVFDVSNMTSPQLVHRLVNAFPAFNETYPPQSGVYFECPDPAKGKVIAWEEKMISQPKCRR